MNPLPLLIFILAVLIFTYFVVRNKYKRDTLPGLSSTYRYKVWNGSPRPPLEKVNADGSKTIPL